MKRNYQLILTQSDGVMNKSILIEHVIMSRMDNGFLWLELDTSDAEVQAFPTSRIVSMTSWQVK